MKHFHILFLILLLTNNIGYALPINCNCITSFLKRLWTPSHPKSTEYSELEEEMQQPLRTAEDLEQEQLPSNEKRNKQEQPWRTLHTQAQPESKNSSLKTQPPATPPPSLFPQDVTTSSPIYAEGKGDDEGFVVINPLTPERPK